MRIAKWNDYELIDTSSGERLERWGNIILIRPDPQIIWDTKKRSPLWKSAHARYIRSSSGGGSWQIYKKIPETWKVKYKNLVFGIKPMGFKHTGVFPEQAVNWDFQMDAIKKEKRELSILNLFAYTGGASIASASAGAKVCHVDASKGMTSWARENAELSSLGNKSIRWIVDDCVKFVKREIRRGKKYDGIIMDPPSYGRGPSGEIWRIEEQLFNLVSLCLPLMSNDPKFFILNSYTTGLSAGVMKYLLEEVLCLRLGGEVISDEIGLPVTTTSLVLPCGSTAIWTK